MTNLTLYERNERSFALKGGGGGRVLRQKSSRGVHEPYPIYDQNLRFSLLYKWPNQKFDTLRMIWS